MLQRIQTVWLLLASVCAALMFLWPLYGGTLPNGTIKLFMANGSFALMLTTGLVALFSFIAVFLFKNRNTQLKVVWIALLLDIVLAVITYVYSSAFAAANNFTQGGYKFTTILPVPVFIFLVMAIRGISADNKLVKSVDRFRN